MYVIIGANGFIGSYIIKNILEKTQEDIIAIGRTINITDNFERIHTLKCDITNSMDISMLKQMLEKEEDLKVVYLAAYHHPDEVMKNVRFAWDINVTSLSRVINYLPKFKCMFYISTEMIYGEGQPNYHFNEASKPKPVNEYGNQKAVAESIVLGYGYNVVRFPFIIGKSLLPGKKHFYDEIVETLSSGKNIGMFADMLKSALDFNTATGTLIDLINSYSTKMPKILNISGDEDLSKYDVGIRIAQANNLNPDLILPIYMNEDSSIFSEQRANCTLLDNTLVKQVLKRSTLKINF